MEWITDTNIWISFFTLFALEIVLGIDNIVFISIITNRLPTDQQAKARRVGLALALLMRIALLFAISWLMQLTAPLFTIANNEISGRDLILLLGGLFLMYKSVKEIHSKIEESGKPADTANKGKFASIIAQIIVLDLVFSFDSVITAVGMVEHIEVMIAAVLASVGVMMLAATSISNFVNRHPTVKVLALAFLLMIGMALMGEGLNFHIPKGFIYFAMAFSVAVEFINIWIKNREMSAKS